MFRLIVHVAVREETLSLPGGVQAKLIHTRGIYVYQREKPIFLLRVLIKKTQKTPSAELRVELKRQQEMLDEQKDY